MPATVIVGLQWGDEGKGKTTDFLAEQVAMVVRYQGGDNAGHTVVVGDETVKLQLCPSGVLYPHITSVIGNGVVVNPATLIRELDMLIARGIDVAEDPRQPQRARDHAVPRGPRQGEREPPRRRQGRHHRARHRAHLRRPRLAPGPPDGGPGRRAHAARAHHAAPSWTRTCCWRRWGPTPSRLSRSSRSDWPGESACDRTSTTPRGWSRTRSAAGTTSSSRAPRARSWTWTTAATRS